MRSRPSAILRRRSESNSSTLPCRWRCVGGGVFNSSATALTVGGVFASSDWVSEVFWLAVSQWVSRRDWLAKPVWVSSNVWLATFEWVSVAKWLARAWWGSIARRIATQLRVSRRGRLAKSRWFSRRLRLAAAIWCSISFQARWTPSVFIGMVARRGGLVFIWPQTR